MAVPEAGTPSVLRAEAIHKIPPTEAPIPRGVQVPLSEASIWSPKRPRDRKSRSEPCLLEAGSLLTPEATGPRRYARSPRRSF